MAGLVPAIDAAELQEAIFHARVGLWRGRA